MSSSTAAAPIYPGYVRHTVQIDAPLSKLLPVARSFFHQDFVAKIVATKGVDNTPGAIRTIQVTLPGTVVKSDQTLVAHHHTKDEVYFKWSIAPNTSIPDPNGDVTYITGQDTFILRSICDGKATEFNYYSEYTTTTPVGAYHVLVIDQTQILFKLCNAAGVRMFGGPFPFDGRSTA